MASQAWLTIRKQNTPWAILVSLRIFVGQPIWRLMKPKVLLARMERYRSWIPSESYHQLQRGRHIAGTLPVLKIHQNATHLLTGQHSSKVSMRLAWINRPAKQPLASDPSLKGQLLSNAKTTQPSSMFSISALLRTSQALTRSTVSSWPAWVSLSA